MELSKTQIDRLGERLKKGNITEADLRLLDSYRRSFTDAYEIVIGAIRKELALEPTGRPAKSTTSISDKLRRESIRLTQIQDIAGCRLTVSDIADQERVVQALSRLFENTIIVDRRLNPSHSYRAVHVIVKLRAKVVEIQVRTSLQHKWAELSEKLSDIVDPAIKYGGGDKETQENLADTSNLVAYVESVETKLAYAVALFSAKGLVQGKEQEINALGEQVRLLRQQLFEFLRDDIKDVEDVKGGDDVISD